MSSAPSPKGQIKGLPYPDGLFEQLAALGDALLSEEMKDWKVTVDKDGYTQYRRPCTSLDLPAVGAAAPHVRSIKTPHDYVAGRGVFPFKISDCVKVIVHEMPLHVAKWDKTFIEVDVVDRWSDEDVCYAYRIDPGPMIGKRDMIYYEGWRTDPATGVVVNVSASMPYLEEAVQLPKGWVRAMIGFHYKRFTPRDDGTRYETIQQMDLGGWLPQSLVNSGAMDGLRTEFKGFTKIMKDLGM